MYVCMYTIRIVSSIRIVKAPEENVVFMLLKKKMQADNNQMSKRCVALPRLSWFLDTSTCAMHIHTMHASTRTLALLCI